MAANFWLSSHSQHWILERSALQSKPEDLKFLSETEIRKVKFYYTQMIQNLGIQLVLRQQVIATAIVYFKRFYTKNSYRQLDALLVAPTCVYLACKVEECTISISQLLTHINQIVKDYPFTKENILDCEFYLLEEMDCYLITFHPYRPLKLYMCTGDLLVQHLPFAWGLVNDSFMTDLCLLFPPHLIAISCIYLTTISQDLEEKKKDTMKQWMAELHVNLDDILEITQELLSVFKMWEQYKAEMGTIDEILKKARPPQRNPGQQ